MKLTKLIAAILFSAIATFGQYTVPQHTGATAASGGGATITLCGSNNTNNFYTTSVITLTCNVAIGDQLVVWTSSNNTCAAQLASAGVTDSGDANAWTKDSDDTQFSCIWSKHIATALTSGTSTVTLHAFTAGSGNSGGWIYKFSPATATPFIGGSNTTASASSLTVTASAALTANTYCFTGFVNGSATLGTTIGGAGSWTIDITANTTNQGGRAMIAGHALFSSGATPSASNTYTAGSQNGSGLIACYTP